MDEQDVEREGGHEVEDADEVELDEDEAAMEVALLTLALMALTMTAAAVERMVDDADDSY